MKRVVLIIIIFIFITLCGVLPLYGWEKSREGERGVQDLLTTVQVGPVTESPSGITSHELLLALLLGLISGVSPTLLKIHADIISEVAQTTRQETDVIIRSLLFNGGIFLVLCALFIILTSSDLFSLITVLLGIVVGFNLVNSALHAFNSFTRIDIILKAKFVTFASISSLQIGILHGVGKFADSAPLFVVVMYLAHGHGSSTHTFLLLIFYLLGIIIVYMILFLYALVGVNIFRKFTHDRIKQGFFLSCALLVLTAAVMLMWDIRTTVNTSLAISLTCILLVISGMIIGFKKRIIY